jgi:hypothetical protein
VRHNKLDTPDGGPDVALPAVGGGRGTAGEGGEEEGARLLNFFSVYTSKS